MARRMGRLFLLLGEMGFGVVVVSLVFTGLTRLVAGGDVAPISRIDAREIKFTRLIRDTEVREKPREKRPEAPERSELGPIPVPGPGVGEGPGLAVRKVVWTSPATERIEGPREMGSGGSDTDLTPLFRIPPEYPPNGRGDGSVLVQFDVSKLGTVVNARVIESTPRGMFDKAALQAIARWRYRPAVIDGQAVERRGVQVRLRFELTEA